MTTPPFTHDGLPVRVVFGLGARRGLAAELDRLGLAHVVLIASGSSRAEADGLVAVLDHRLTWRVDGVRQHVPAELAAAVVEDARRVAVDGVVTLGGGSATGLGKAVARDTGLPLVAIPTTYAGSEMTPVWGMTTAGRKQTGRDPRVLPRTVVYDPELTLTLPRPATAASGMNAVAHCLEGLWSAGASPLSSPLAARMAVAVGAGRASTGLYDLSVRLGLPMALAALGMPAAGVDEVAAEVAGDPPANPRSVDEASLRAVLRAAWAGDPPG